MSSNNFFVKEEIHSDHGLGGVFRDQEDWNEWEEWPIEEKTEVVDHPDHYNQSSLEVIDAIEGLGYAEGFCIGSIIKYVTRYKHKNGIEDLKKAQWYIDYLIKMEEK